MKKKGFTLIELLAVLVILGLIAVITVTAVSSTLKAYKETLYDKQLKSIESATRLWLGEHMLVRPNSSTSTNTCVYGEACEAEYSKLIITLKDLQDGGYIDKNLKNVKTNDTYANIKIVITKDGNKEDIEVLDKAFFAYNVGDEVEVELSSQTTLKFYVIANSNKNNTYIKAISKDPVQIDSVSTWAWCVTGCTPTGNEARTPKNIETNVLTNLSSSWSNATEIKLISKEEIELALEVMENDSEDSKKWIYGLKKNGNSYETKEYWISTPFGNDYAYYMTSTGTLQYANENILKSVRPVIKINKSYIKY